MSDPTRTVLSGARFVLPDAVVDGGTLTVEAGRIGAVPAAAPRDGADATSLSVAATPVAGALDLTGYTVVPGFVDLHTHGGGGGSYATGDAAEVAAAARTHLLHGTTTTMASTVTGPFEELYRQAAMLSELVEDGLLAGVHFEGPFISTHRCGAHDPALLRAPDPALVRKLVESARGAARMVTLAPELEGGLDSVRLLADLGVIAAVGHTDAGYEAVLAAVDAGATVATHLFNAMPPVGHRAPGPVVALLEDERVTVELVGDGVHLHPSVVDLAVRAAGTGRVALVTDAMQAAGSDDGRYLLGALEVDVVDGVARLVEGGSIAGSTLTLDTAFRRAVTVNGYAPEQASRMLSLNPARLLGLGDRTGSLETGKQADLVVLDADWQVAAVMRQGVWASGGERFTPLRTG